MVNALSAVKGRIDLTHDRDINISTGKSRKDTKWKNGTVKWSDFVSKIANTHRTHETLKEYRSMKKSSQDDIKDVGGFVGGRIEGGRRKAGNIESRSILTLDIDHADEYTFDLIKNTFSNAWAIYSTHKHTEEHPRLRLVIPLSRDVTSEEYLPLGKKVAENIGIDYFDDTTYEPHRLMYWPSTSKDGEYVFDYNDAEMLDPSDVLAEYGGDWSDPSNWPVSSRQDSMHKAMADKQGDPHTKPGLVGAFNRAYSIDEAISTFLSDIYTEHSDDRYTFKEGSTAGGLVVYEGKFAYSHHGTDIISSRLVNSFDLVRLHKYGALDDDMAEDAPVTKLPSYKEMTTLAQNDGKVKRQLMMERMEDVAEDFTVIEDSVSTGTGDFGVIDVSDDEYEAGKKADKAADRNKWQERLRVNKNGLADPSIPNLTLILNNDPNLKGRIAHNDFSARMVRKGITPWNRNSRTEYWTDADDAGLREYIEAAYGIYNRGKLEDAVFNTARRNAFHPIREYLDGLEWDGVKRLETMFTTFLGAEDTDITRAMTRKAFTAAVARIYNPGLKFDYMVVLYGPQGVGKSMIFNKMGGEFYSDSLTTVTGREAYEALQGAWIVEMAELAAAKKAEVESIKHFISKQEDRFRVAYGRHIEEFPRQCVFFGTTNKEDFLRDETGGRRFWPVTVAKNKPERSWTSISSEERDQLWAEAKHYFLKDEPLYLDKAMEEKARELQNAHTEEHAWEGLIKEYLDTEIPTDWEDYSLQQRLTYLNSDEFDVIDGGSEEVMQRRFVSPIEVWVECLGNDRNRFNRVEQRIVRDILSGLDGWENYSGTKDGRMRTKLYGLQKTFERKN